MLLPLSPIQKPPGTKHRCTRETGSQKGRWTKQGLRTVLDVNSTWRTPKPAWRQLDLIAVAQAPVVRKEGVSWALEHSSARSIPPSDIKKTLHKTECQASRQMDWKAGFFFTQSVLSSQTMLNKMFPHLIHAAVTKCRCTLHNRENVKVLVGYMQLEDCMGFLTVLYSWAVLRPQRKWHHFYLTQFWFT